MVPPWCLFHIHLIWWEIESNFHLQTFQDKSRENFSPWCFWASKLCRSRFDPKEWSSKIGLFEDFVWQIWDNFLTFFWSFINDWWFSKNQRRVYYYRGQGRAECPVFHIPNSINYFGSSKSILDDIIDFVGDFGVDTIKKVFKTFFVIEIRIFLKDLCFFFKFVSQKSVVNSDYFLDLDIFDSEIFYLISVETRFD